MITIETDNNALTLKEEEKALEELMQEGDSAPPQVRARAPETSSAASMTVCRLSIVRSSHSDGIGTCGEKTAGVVCQRMPIRAELPTASLAGPS